MSVYTSSQLTTDHGPRLGQKPHRVVLHHAASTSLPGLIELMQPGGRTVSAHAAIGGAEVVNTVPEDRSSYSLSAQPFERGVLTAECVNSTLAPDYRLSSETHESIARWVADVCTRWGIRPHRDGVPGGWTVLGHREVYTIHGVGYSTACPGGMDLDWIVQRAQDIMAGGQEEESMKYIWNGVSGTGARYALIDPIFDGGYVESSALADAEGFSGMAPMPGAPHVREGVKFDRTLHFAKKARADYLASQGQVTVGSLTLDAASIAALAEANAKAFFVEQKKAGN